MTGPDIVSRDDVWWQMEEESKSESIRLWAGMFYRCKVTGDDIRAGADVVCCKLVAAQADDILGADVHDTDLHVVLKDLRAMCGPSEGVPDRHS